MPWIDPVDEFARPPRFSAPATPPAPWNGEFESVHGVTRVESVTLEGVTIDAEPHGMVEILDCALSGVMLETTGSSRFDLLDCTLAGCDLSRARIDTIRGAHLVDCKLAGADLSEGTIRDSRFERCALRYANLRLGTLERVAFSDCGLDETDLYAATLEDVMVEESELRAVTVDATRFQRVDLRGARSLHLEGLGDLRGCLVTDLQAQQLAIRLALAAGAALERPE